MKKYRHILWTLSTVAFATLLASCSTTSVREGESVAIKEARYVKVNFDALPRVSSGNWKNALSAFKRSCKGDLNRKADFQEACFKASETMADEAEEFFKENFEPWTVYVPENTSAPYEGLMTGYYEPMLYGSKTKSKRYKYPIYGSPDDLLTVDLSSVYPKLRGMTLKGKVVGKKVVPYDSRAQLARRTDLDKAALCWVDDAVDAFFLQIQGSGRVVMPDGRFMRLGYAESNGHPYRALARWLIDNAHMKPSEMSMQRIKAWTHQNPRRTQELLNYNPNYVFFTERLGFADDEGPLGSEGVPLTAEGSVAVDRSFYPMGVPFVIKEKGGFVSELIESAHAVIAQDTGGAIRGPIRFDFFWGYGDKAGQNAGAQKSAVNAWILAPKGKTPAELK